MRNLLLPLGALFLLLPSTAQAHFTLLAPPPSLANSTDGGKGPPPCGPDAASNVVTPAQGGHPLTVNLTETTFHPGFYRIALSINSRTELPPDNVVKDAAGNILTVTGAVNSASAVYTATPLKVFPTDLATAIPAVFPVLAANLWPHTTRADAVYATELSLATGAKADVILPNVTCAKCTLQVIEFMNQHGANPGGGYFYHHCADLKITADPALPAFNPTGGTGGGGAGGAASGGASGVAGAQSGGSSGAGVAGGDAGGAVGSVAGAGGAESSAGAPGSASAGAPGAAGASAAGAPGSAGAPATAGASAAGAQGTGTDANKPDDGGCSLGNQRAPGSRALLLSVLLGLSVLGGRRRARRRAA